MEWLVMLHVLSVVIGLGPAFFIPIFLKDNQSLSEMRVAFRYGKYLTVYPKTGGLLAVLSGIALVWLGDYGTWMQLWLYGALILFVIIQIIMLAVIAPRTKKIAEWLYHPTNQSAVHIPFDIEQMKVVVRSWHMVGLSLSIVILLLMVLKPV